MTMKQYIYLVFVLLVSIGANAQSASVSIEHITATPGQEIDVPVTVTGFAGEDKLGAVSMFIAYDPGVLEYTGFKEEVISGFFVNAYSIGNGLNNVAASFTSTFGINIDDGDPLIVITFLYKGGSTDLTFTEECEFAIAGDDATLYDMTYNDGSVSPLNPDDMIQVIIGTEQEALLNEEVPVPVTVRNFENIGAFDFEIAFNTGSLEFVTINNLDEDIDPENLEFNAAGSNLFIGYNMPPGTGLTLEDDESLFDLVFIYKGGTSPLIFNQAVCEVSEFEDLALLPVLYVNGEVSGSEILDVTATIADVITPPGEVDVPLTVTGFEKLGAFDFTIEYIPSDLVYVGIENIHPLLTANGTLIPNQSGSDIIVAWNLESIQENGIDIPDDEKLFDIRFTTATQGVTPLTFNLLPNEVTRLEDGDFITLAVSYFNGSVTVTEDTQLTVKVMLEGFFNSGTGEMNKAKDFVDGEIVDKFPGTVADVIRIELHEEGNYGTPVFAADEVELNQDGTASVSIPGTFSNSYYVTIRHRNHLETVSAVPVSFADAEATHDFTTTASQAFGNNQKQLATGVYGIYAGDVNQDGVINIDDVGPINTGIRRGNRGYISIDIDGSGTINVDDVGPVNTNIRRGIQRRIP